MNFFRKLKAIISWEKVFVKPDFDLDAEIYAQLKPFRLPLILIQIMMIIKTQCKPLVVGTPAGIIAKRLKELDNV